jgi:hypothetical protein
MKITHCVAAAAAVTLALAGCGDDPVEDNPDLEGCEHLQEGPFQQLTAGATRDSTAPMIDDDHVAYRITQPGFVFFGTGDAGDYHFFFSDDAPVEVTDPNGDVVVPEETSTGSETCDDIAVRYLMELAVGTNYLELTGTGEVTIVVEPAAHEAHE